MNKSVNKVLTVGGTAVLAVSMGAGVAYAGSAQEGQDCAIHGFSAQQAFDRNASESNSAAISAEKVEGNFSFSQGIVSSNDYIAKNILTASKYLCGSVLGSEECTVAPHAWNIAVTGDVEESFSASIAELAEEGSAQLVMGCSCGGNPSDGIATANAEVCGISISSIIDRAHVKDGVNTVVFTCADGYSVELPYLYVIQHFSLIAYELNGEAISNSMGGNNQLWLGSTAASYFARDIVGVSFETRENPPARPGSPDAGMVTNTPNVGVVEAKVAS